jgi:hypothetical protein
MVVIMLRTNVCALLTHFSAQLTNLPGKITAPGHGSGGQSTYSRAIEIGANTIGHHAQIFFRKARAGAIIAGCGAAVTLINTGCVFLVSHHLGLRGT